MWAAALIITLSFVFVCVAVVLIVLIGHIRIYWRPSRCHEQDWPGSPLRSGFRSCANCPHEQPLALHFASCQPGNGSSQFVVRGWKGRHWGNGERKGCWQTEYRGSRADGPWTLRPTSGLRRSIS